MPDHAIDLEEQIRSLLALRRELEELLHHSAEGARPVDLGQPIGRLSRMEALQQQSMIQAGRRGAELRLQQVEAALRRLGEGEYGACLECGEEIEPLRLKARPEAPLCLACQRSRERR